MAIYTLTCLCFIYFERDVCARQLHTIIVIVYFMLQGVLVAKHIEKTFFFSLLSSHLHVFFMLMGIVENNNTAKEKNPQGTSSIRRKLYPFFIQQGYA